MFELSGRLEVRKNGIWGTICNNNTDEDTYSSSQKVDDRVALVACRQMGYTVGRLQELSIVQDGVKQIWMDELNCNGTETRLDACNWNDKTHPWQWGNLTNSCVHANDIGIGCDN